MKQLYLFTINEGKRDTFLSWCAELKTRELEVLESLERENCVQESCWEIPGYVVGFAEWDGEPKKYESTLNEEHRQKLRECLTLVRKVAVL